MITLSALDSKVDLRLARKLFYAGAVIVLLSLPLQVVRIKLSENVPESLREAAALKHAVSDHKPGKLEEAQYYEDKLSDGTFWGIRQTTGGPVFQTTFAELIKNYRLKGVVLLDEAEAIVEDAGSQKSLFLREGDLLGEVTVKTIGEGVLVLSYLGEESRGVPGTGFISPRNANDGHDSQIVIPAEAGIQSTKPTLDSRFRGNDRQNNDLRALMKPLPGTFRPLGTIDALSNPC